MGKTFKDGHKQGYRPRPRGDEDEHHEAVHHHHQAVAPVIPQTPRPPSPPRGQRPDNNTRRLATATFNGDGKIFYLDAIENERGKALRIAEVSKGKRTIILIPAALIVEYENQLSKVTPVLVQS